MDRRREYESSSGQYSALRDLVAQKRRALSGRLDLCWLDFIAQPIHVVKADGRVIIEKSMDAQDKELYRIPLRIKIESNLPIQVKFFVILPRLHEHSTKICLEITEPVVSATSGSRLYISMLHRRNDSARQHCDGICDSTLSTLRKR